MGFWGFGQRRLGISGRVLMADEVSSGFVLFDIELEGLELNVQFFFLLFQCFDSIGCSRYLIV